MIGRKISSYWQVVWRMLSKAATGRWPACLLVLQREKILPGAVAPWGLMIHVTNHGGELRMRRVILG